MRPEHSLPRGETPARRDASRAAHSEPAAGPRTNSQWRSRSTRRRPTSHATPTPVRAPSHSTALAPDRPLPARRRQPPPRRARRYARASSTPLGLEWTCPKHSALRRAATCQIHPDGSAKDDQQAQRCDRAVTGRDSSAASARAVAISASGRKTATVGAHAAGTPNSRTVSGAPPAIGELGDTGEGEDDREYKP